MANQIRIIGGQWKRTPLAVVESGGVRPTPNRVRETLFNWLTHADLGEMYGLNVLDCFAGSGALGFEAASRGAAHVVLLEHQREAIKALRATQQKLKANMVEIIQADALQSLPSFVQRGLRFELIFLDPPFGAGWVVKVWPWLQALLTPFSGRIYVEAEKPLTQLFAQQPEYLAPFEISRSDKAGQVFYHLLRCKKTYESQSPC